MRKEVDNRGPDAAVARIAARQHGVATAEQIARTGLSPAGVTRRVAAGRLHRIHRGVYAVGHKALSERGRWMAAVLACGEGAVLSHRSAAELWGIRRPVRRPAAARGRGESAAVHVTVRGTSGRLRREGIVLHRSSTLTTGECTRRESIPVTRPARTLDDLSNLLSPAELDAAVREAEFLRLPIGERSAVEAVRTELEQRFLVLCRRHRLPQPGVNVRIDRFEVDFLWREHRLVVEVDGWNAHRTRSAFEEDRARDAQLKLLGYEVLRFTWRQIRSDPRGVARTVRAFTRC